MTNSQVEKKSMCTVKQLRWKSKRKKKPKESSLAFKLLIIKMIRFCDDLSAWTYVSNITAPKTIKTPKVMWVKQ